MMIPTDHPLQNLFSTMMTVFDRSVEQAKSSTDLTESHLYALIQDHCKDEIARGLDGAAEAMSEDAGNALSSIEGDISDAIDELKQAHRRLEDFEVTLTRRDAKIVADQIANDIFNELKEVLPIREESAEEAA